MTERRLYVVPGSGKSRHGSADMRIAHDGTKVGVVWAENGRSAALMIDGERFDIIYRGMHEGLIGWFVLSIQNSVAYYSAEFAIGEAMQRRLGFAQRKTAFGTQ